jgi:DNA-binding transcriptional regulator YiaG
MTRNTDVRIMSDPDMRLSVADRILQGLKEAIPCARGELELRTTVVEVPPRPMSPREIIRLRESMGRDRRTFALELDVSESTLRRWERGDQCPSAKSLSRLQKAKARAETRETSPYHKSSV